MPISKTMLSIGLLACAQAGLIIGLYRYGLAGSVALILLYAASLVACYVLLNRSARWARGGSGRRSLGFVVALVLAGAVQSVAAVTAIAVAFTLWGT
jgi:hypothetical protein